MLSNSDATIYRMRTPVRSLARNTVGSKSVTTRLSMPFTVAHAGARTLSVQLFSAEAVLSELLGCPLGSHNATALRERLISSDGKQWKSHADRGGRSGWNRDDVLLHRRSSDDESNGMSALAAAPAQPPPAALPPLSFPQVLRWLERCTRLAGTDCGAQTQADCDEATIGFTAGVDFTMGTQPSVRTCAVATPRRSISSDQSDMIRWAQDRERERGSSFSLRVIKAHVLDTLEVLARPAYAELLHRREGATWGATPPPPSPARPLSRSPPLPALLASAPTPPKRRIVDVGAGGGLIDAYLMRKYWLEVTAYDVAAPSENAFAYEASATVPIHLFNGSHLPTEADASADAVMFNSVLHHAAHHAPALLDEARRISRRWVIVVEDVDVRGERNPREGYILHRHAKHGAPMTPRGPKGVFRTQAEWTRLLQHGGQFTVTRVGVVSSLNLSAEFRHTHRLSQRWSKPELTGPSYQRYFVAERCLDPATRARRHRQTREHLAN